MQSSWSRQYFKCVAALVLSHPECLDAALDELEVAALSRFMREFLFMVIAFRSDARSLMHALHARGVDPNATDNVFFDAAIAANALPLVEALVLDFHRVPSVSWVVVDAAARGQLQMLQLLDAHGLIKADEFRPIKDASARNGHASILAWVHTHHGVELTVQDLRAARKREVIPSTYEMPDWDAVITYLSNHGVVDTEA